MNLEVISPLINFNTSDICAIFLFSSSVIICRNTRRYSYFGNLKLFHSACGATGGENGTHNDFGSFPFKIHCEMSWKSLFPTTVGIIIKYFVSSHCTVTAYLKPFFDC